MRKGCMKKNKMISVSGIAVILISILFVSQKEVQETDHFLTNIALIEAVERSTESDGHPIDWVKEKDGTVRLTSENLKAIRSVKQLDISGWRFSDENKLTDLSGIELFTGLVYLDCRWNLLTSLDVSKNSDLQSLDCTNNQLTSLDVSKNSALTSLHCSANSLKDLDVSKNTALTFLNCEFNRLSELDVTDCGSLEELYCGQQSSEDEMKQTLMLTLTAEQKEKWGLVWSDVFFNPDVTLK